MMNDATPHAQADPPSSSQSDPILHPPGDPARRRRGARLLLAGVVLALGLLVGYGVWAHAQRRNDAVETLQQQQAIVPEVRTSLVTAVTQPRQVDLPGSTEAFESATVFARATGYIAERFVDIGSKVKQGDVLAIIAAPDLDQQLVQAREQLTQLQAAVDQARANANLAQATDARTKSLVVQGWQTRQQGDIDRLTYVAQTAALRVAEVNVKAQQAAVARLEAQTGFERVTAPFSGIITRRQIDVGNLVTADVSSGTPMFSIDRTDVLRVLVYVPQDYVFGIKDGESADVIVPEVPGRIFKGKVARNASSLDPATRTLQAEVDVDNSQGFLHAGLYCSVRFEVPRQAPTIIIPGQSVIFDKDGLSAAVFEDGVARLRHLDLERDNGATVEVRAGLKPGDRIILNPPVGIQDGMKVTSSASSEEKPASGY
jgi:RND family efflux transporter MFP subunit